MPDNVGRREDGGLAAQGLPAEIVCFGMITPAVVMTVDALPAHNTGAIVREIGEFISDDAAIVACLLAQWGVRSRLLGTALGEDRAGQQVAARLRELGVLGPVRFSPEIDTPLEVNISDPGGGRTFFWRRDPRVLATLDSVDLSLLDGARLLYVDWYDGDHILRATAEAVRKEIPVFLNLEHGHQDSGTLRSYTRGVKICQVVTDEAQSSKEAMEVARRVSGAGVDTVLVTLGANGCLAMRGNDTIRVEPPEVSVADGCAAGATFSAGFAYGFLRCWDLEASVRFATAAASLKCGVLGPVAYPLDEIRSAAGQLRVERAAPSP